VAITAAPVAPTVTGVSPSSGSTAGGTSVTITGTGFTGATAVDFGTTAATSETVNSATSITAVSPAESAGTVDVTVTGPGGTSATSSADQFTYQTPSTTPPPAANAPVVSFVFPNEGFEGHYSLVFIFGEHFTGVTGVHFGTAAGLYKVFDQNLILALAPPSKTTGKVAITVTNASGTSAAASNATFTYIAPFSWLS